jgi:hypothetical protein
VAGLFGGSIDFGGGPLKNDDTTRDVFLAGFEPDGTHRFSLSLAVESPDDAVAAPRLAVLPSGDVVLAGAFAGAMDTGDQVITSAASSSDIYVVRLTGAALALP